MLRIIYSDKKSIFELIEKVNSVWIHKRDWSLLAIEVFKFKKRFGPAQNKQSRYELQNNVDFTLSSVKSVHKGLELELLESKNLANFAGWHKTNQLFVRIQR